MMQYKNTRIEIGDKIDVITENNEAQMITPIKNFAFV